MEEPEAPLQRATAIKGFAATRNARNFRAEFSVAAARERGSATPAKARRQQIYMLKFIIGREIQPERGVPAGGATGRGKWVEKRDIKKEGKGRPVHAYRLSLGWADILAQVDREEQAKIDRIEA